MGFNFQHHVVYKLKIIRVIGLDCNVTVTVIIITRQCKVYLPTGSLLDIAPAIQGSVTITAPFNKRTKRHILFKV